MNTSSYEIEKFNNFFSTYGEHVKGEQGFGSLNEKTVHAVLKDFYASTKDDEEVMISGFIADVFHDGIITEIQTKQFGNLKKKLAVFLNDYPVRIVYPYPYKNKIIWVDPQTGEQTNNSRTTTRGSVYSVFEEVFRILGYVKHPNLSLTVLLLETSEIRLLDGLKQNKKRRATKVDRFPVALIDKYEFNDYRDFYALIPPELSNFTVKDFAKAAKIPEQTASITLRVFYELNIVNRIGKGSHGAYIYEVTEP